MIGDKKPVSVNRYLHGTTTSVKGAQQSGAAAVRTLRTGAGLTRGSGAESNGVEARDPLEVMLLAGDRDEYVDRSFWHDAEADGVTFQESRVDGRWDEDGNEWWK